MSSVSGAAERNAYNGTVLATDAQEFGSPQVTTTAAGDPELSLQVAGPHLTVSGDQNVGYFDAFLPSALLTRWRVTDPQNLTVDAIGQSITPASTQSGRGIRLTLTPHYSSGDVSIAADNTDPKASATVDDSTPTTGQTVTFDATASKDDNAVDAYAWDFGDGTQATGAAPTHSYAASGTYAATVTVTDGAGNTDTATVSVTVSEPNSGPSAPAQPASGGSSGSGGGGGSASGLGTYETRSQGSLRDGVVSVGLRGGTGVNGVDVEIPAGEGRVTVREYSSLPDGVPAPPDRLVAAVDVSAPDPTSGDATVRIRVSKTLVGAFGADPTDLVVRHYDAEAGTWETLDTRLVAADPVVVLEATTDGFSPFAVTTGGDAATDATATPESTPTADPSTPEPTAAAETATPESTPTAGPSTDGTPTGAQSPGFGALAAALALLVTALLAARRER
jgi:PGF-CTERM protein